MSNNERSNNIFNNENNMRIVDTDNFGGDYPDEEFLLWPMKKADAQAIVDILNKCGGNHSLRYYKVVPYDYELKPGFEP
jgi:hypothetical protein